jgi:hypothetical protein
VGRRSYGLDAALDPLVDSGIAQTRAQAQRHTVVGDVGGRELLEVIYKPLHP